jgi:hypothetical protein
MKLLSNVEANAILQEIGMSVGQWNEIATGRNGLIADSWIARPAPRDAKELRVFSQYVAGWVPGGRWKLLQISNSTFPDAAESAMLERLLFGTAPPLDLTRPENSSFLFEFGGDAEKDRDSELLIAWVIYAFLLFECHGQVISSHSASGRHLGVYDGVAYLQYGTEGKAPAQAILNDFDRDRMMSPPWVLDIIAHRQELDLARGAN